MIADLGGTHYNNTMKVLKSDELRWIKLTQGATEIIRPVDCSRDTAVVNDLVCTITVNFQGKTAKKIIVSNESGVIWFGEGKHNSHTFNVFKSAEPRTITIVTASETFTFNTEDEGADKQDGNTATYDVE